ncbi:hypothetical protein ACM46_15925 [Chryseobacterium angstadtii]|uniref:PET hydrolase/cutinase-like domain-containing protein n=2 Tax=Chryseobacterium angstadtii TaxID=558151 RepID=A0A0J7KX78_9FLAO|nr:hypothetical protein ACM46_15925 [Chryseobacterium angstadtii]
MLDSPPNNPIMAESQNASKSVLFPATGIANEQYATTGPYQVTTTAMVGKCENIGGIITDVLKSINVLDNSFKCTNNFPYGNNGLPINMSVYYPENIQNLSKLPVVNFVGGFTSNDGNYYDMAKLWASHGFVVIVSSNFVNVTPAMHVFAAIHAAKLNKDSQSPLYGKIDLSKMIVSGHSAGGGASFWAASFPESALHLIDPELKVVGSLPIQPSPLALGVTVKAPTFILTSALDYIVPAFVPQVWYGPQTQHIPVWSATATTGTHFSPTMEVPKNEFAGITVAWLKYKGYNDSEAKAYFEGSNYKLKQDKQFIQAPFLYQVKRNGVAANLQ